MLRTTNLEFPDIIGFNFMIKRSCLNKKSHFHEIDLHSHKELEIYINLSGDVSFLVENNLYPISRGDIIIARPGEYHHCVYRSDKDHNLFWILINTEGNADLLSFFLQNINSNLISPYKNAKDEVIELCETLIEGNLSDFDRYYHFFRLMRLIKNNADSTILDLNAMPNELVLALDYIDTHISENIKVADIANLLYLSESTVERRFKKYIDMKPLEFIHKRKMILAAQLLQNGETVLNTGMSVGYSDHSYFINIFKNIISYNIFFKN